MTKPLNKIVIVGEGLAAHLSALALQQQLSDHIELVLVSPNDQTQTDLLYGSTAAPEIYDFHVQLGIDEPELLLNTNTTFSWGTHYKNWANTDKNWIQCYHLPLPVEEGVEFQHLAQRHSSDQSIEEYLISSQAALKGKFAHPPEDNRHPLSRAEYGYQFDPNEWSQLYASKLNHKRITIIKECISSVVRTDNEIEHLMMANGTSISADLFIDCTGPDAVVSNIGRTSQSSLATVIRSCQDNATMGPAQRVINSFDFGWQSATHLRNRVVTLTLCASPDRQQAIESLAEHEPSCFDVTLTRSLEAWVGNCVAIGQSANTVEPLTDAPMRLLLRDIQRLLELIPRSADMTIEATEYNRRFIQDAEHASLFHDALFALDNLPNGSYWQQHTANDRSQKLARKLAQFGHRGVLINYDLEPFNEQDWLILYSGMAIKPQILDPVARRLPEHEFTKRLDTMRNIISQVTHKMPEHGLYMSKLLQYLKQNRTTRETN